MKHVKYPLLTTAFLVGIHANLLSQGAQLNYNLQELAKLSQHAIDQRPDSLTYYADAGLELAKVQGDLKFIADFKRYKGIDASNNGNSESAISYLNSAIEDNRLLKRESDLAICTTDLGMVYAKLTDYPKAVQLHLDALSIAEKLGDEKLIALIHNNLGLSYKDNGKLEESLTEYKKAVDIFSKTGLRDRLAGCYINIGNVEFLLKHYPGSLKYYHEALGMFEETQQQRGQAAVLNSIADVFRAQGKLADSQSFRDKALSVSVSNGLVSSEIIALAGEGELKTAQRQYDQALQFFNQGINKAEQTANSKAMLRLLPGISQCYADKGEPAKALSYFKQYAELKDSLFRQDTEKYMANLRVLSELGKKETEIESLRKDQKIATLGRNLILVGSLGVFTLLGFVIYALRQKRKNDQRLLIEQEQIHKADKANAELELRQQREHEEELKRELDFRSRALTTYTLNLVQKNGMMEEIKSSLQEILKSGSSHDHELKKLVRLVDYSYSLDKDWDGFKTYFEQVHPEFFKKLKEEFPQISTTELRLCALIRLSLSIKEAATVLNIAPDSVKVARHRIRKKLNLPTDASITDFIMSI